MTNGSTARARAGYVRFHRLLAAGAVCFAITGCGDFSALFPGLDTRPTSGLEGLPSSGQTLLESELNDDFADAEFVDADEKVATIQGVIEQAIDVDLYDLGPVSPGDRVYAEVFPDATLYGAVALFDADGAALLINDHRNVFNGRVEPYVDVTMLTASANVYLAVTHTPGFESTGTYTITSGITRGQGQRVTRPDVILLDFAGANSVSIGSRAAVNVPRFDAAYISTRYSGATQELMDRMVALVRRDFEPYEVTIRSTHEGAFPDDTTTRIFFGTFDAGLLGVAEGVDEFNGASRQSAIVFTDTFAAFEPLEPDIEEMALALANVASHEIGHLLGLVHTADSQGIMDITASLNDLLTDQSFRVSALHPDVFPIGAQDAPRSLSYSVGLRPGADAYATQDVPDELARTRTRTAGPEMRRRYARSRYFLSSCCLRHRAAWAQRSEADDE